MAEPQTPFKRLRTFAERGIEAKKQGAQLGIGFQSTAQWKDGYYAKKSIRPGSAVVGTSMPLLMKTLWDAAKSADAIVPGNKNLMLGLLEGDPDSKSPALDYAADYFGGDNPIPLNAETYNAFNAVMYRAFLEGQLPGKVSYYQPSIDDLRVTLMDSGVLANNIDFTQTPDARKRSFSTFQAALLGSPGLSSAPLRKRSKK